MALRLSASLGELDKLACCISVSDTTLANYLDSPPSSLATVHSQLALARQQILLLESENAFFREEVDNLQRNASFLYAEISVLQVTLDYVKRSKVLRLPQPDKGKIFQLEKRLADYQKIIHALAEGLSLDPNILTKTTYSSVYHGQESESALVEAIQTAARNKDSSWSRILPTLTKSAQEKHVAAINLILATRKDLHDMEKLALFWKARATLPRPVAFHRNIAGFPPGDGSPTAATSVFSFSARPPLLVPVSPRHLKENIPRSITSSSHPLERSHSDGINSSTNRSIRKSRTQHVRRAASHDFKSLGIQVPGKRHGFIMPCIKSDPNKHSPGSANVHSGLNESAGTGSVGPFATIPSDSLNSVYRISLRTAWVFKSAERLCATFSSGSLGSLEASTLSEPNTDTVLDTFLDDSQSLQDLIVVDAATSVNHRNLAYLNRNPSSSFEYDQIKNTDNNADRDGTCPGGKNVVPGRPEDFSVPSPTPIKLTENHHNKVSPPTARAATSRVSHQLTGPPSARTVRPCRGGVSACQPKTGRSLSNQSRTAPPSLRLHVSSSSNLTRTPLQTPGSGFTLKSALAKPSAVTSEISQRPPLFTSSNEARKHLSTTKPRGRLRVVNNTTQGDLSSNEALPSKLSARQRHARPDSTIPDKNRPKSTGIRDGNLHSQLVSRGRSEGGKPIGSMSGTTGVTGRDLSHLPSAKAKTVMVEGRRTKRT